MSIKPNNYLYTNKPKCYCDQMYYELEITLNDEYIDVKVNYNIITFFRQFNTTNECWYDVKLNKNDIKSLKNLVKTDSEKEFIDKIKENQTIDILEHVRF